MTLDDTRFEQVVALRPAIFFNPVFLPRKIYFFVGPRFVIPEEEDEEEEETEEGEEEEEEEEKKTKKKKTKKKKNKK